MSKFLAIVPAYNEAGAIAGTVGEILRVGEVRALVGAVERRGHDGPRDAVSGGEDEQDDERRGELTQGR